MQSEQCSLNGPPASYVVCDIETGEAYFETWNLSVIAKLNPAKAVAVPILEYLQRINGVNNGKPAILQNAQS